MTCCILQVRWMLGLSQGTWWAVWKLLPYLFTQICSNLVISSLIGLKFSALLPEIHTFWKRYREFCYDGGGGCNFNKYTGQISGHEPDARREAAFLPVHSDLLWSGYFWSDWSDRSNFFSNSSWDTHLSKEVKTSALWGGEGRNVQKYPRIFMTYTVHSTVEAKVPPLHQ